MPHHQKSNYRYLQNSMAMTVGEAFCVGSNDQHGVNDQHYDSKDGKHSAKEVWSCGKIMLYWHAGEHIYSSLGQWKLHMLSNNYWKICFFSQEDITRASNDFRMVCMPLPSMVRFYSTDRKLNSSMHSAELVEYKIVLTSFAIRLQLFTPNIALLFCWTVIAD